MNRRSQWGARAAGLAFGMMADGWLADPRRGHPVALFGDAASALERRVWRDSRWAGTGFWCAMVAPVVVGAFAGERVLRRWPALQSLLLSAGVWASLGGRSLTIHARAVQAPLQSGNLAAARERVGDLCARDTRQLTAAEVARACVESVAENTSDAIVGPLVWGLVAGLPGVLGYRAINTLDAMVGYRSDRYRRFGWCSARVDDAVNLIPARLTAALAVGWAPAVGGSMGAARDVARRDGCRHPSPNGGHCEAAFAGALGIRLGGRNVYGLRVEQRPALGRGRAPDGSDIALATRLSRHVAWTTAGVCVAVALRVRRLG